jgi:hypothetical protein
MSDDEGGGSGWRDYGHRNAAPKSSLTSGGGSSQAIQNNYQRLMWRCNNYNMELVSEVLEILDEKRPGNITYYLVRYKAFPAEKNNSWVKESCSNITRSLVDAWKSKRKKS